MVERLQELQKLISCKVLTDETTLISYSTDASAYRERPDAVVFPKTVEDIRQIIRFASKEKINLIFRGAGTSLAGQVVGKGIIVDISKHFNHILEINKEQNYVVVEPGVVRDVLNNALKPYGKFFAPETSTSNRCTTGGMVGNNSCGLHSVAWGTTRDNVLSLECILSDGSSVEFHHLTAVEAEKKLLQNDKEGEIYRYIHDMYADNEIKEEIRKNFPAKNVIRRNNGYALDEISDFSDIDLTKLICGSEGTLCYITKIKLKIIDLPSPHRAAICVHFNSLRESFYANLECLKYSPIAVELMDDNITAAAQRNEEQRENLFFIKGNPKAIIVDELCKSTSEELEKAINDTIAALKEKNLGYEYVIVRGEDIKRVWELRKAGLGLLTNVPGDNKPVSVIEDTAVAAEDLPEYMEDFAKILDKYNLQCVYHAHIASGELHLRPVLNLKKQEDVTLFRKVAHEVALTVKKYRGSLSGEHGDGRLRGEFIPLMYGQKVYQLMKGIKQCFDPDNIFNRGKITDTPSMDCNLRYDGYIKHPVERRIKTYYSFEKEISFLQAAEQCNGAGVCRKDSAFGGSMCPSFRANDNDERFSTRARANIIREIFTYNGEKDPFVSQEIKDLLDECLMCKGCKRECPSNVDMTKIKSEFLQQRYDKKGIPTNVLLMSYLPAIEHLGSVSPLLYNFFVSNRLTSSLIKKMMKFAPQRSLPVLNHYSFRQIYSHYVRKHGGRTDNNGNTKYIYLLADEFSNYQDARIAEMFFLLLHRLGYEVRLAPVNNCGRILFSKGLLKRGKKLAEKNIRKIKDLISSDHPLVGIEPSAVLSFRDEYPLLVKEDISDMVKNCLCFDEFLYGEIQKGNIKSSQFTDENLNIIYHTHCQQKAIIGEKYMQAVLNLPNNYHASAIPSGCCGMAGSFGYEAKHYATSEKIVHQVITKHIEKADKDTIVCASGTSCREQIKHFTDCKPLHPIEVLFHALK
ncbi:MAG: FAD-binding protein [Bacteroidales bacterium]|nr:FAD-binding protein [Bacteroidales bacterium]